MAESPVPYIRQCAAELRECIARSSQTQSTLPDSVFEGVFSSAIEQVYTSRDAFLQTSQSALNLMLLFYTAGATLLLFLFTSDHQPAQVQVLGTAILAATCFVTPAFLSQQWCENVNAGYDLYTAAVIHATIVARAIGAPLTHRWLELVEECNNAVGVFKNNDQIFIPCNCGSAVYLDSSVKVIAVWRSRRPNLFSFYDAVFRRGTHFVAATALIACIVVCVIAVLCPDNMFPKDPKDNQGVQAAKTTLIQSERTLTPTASSDGTP